MADEKAKKTTRKTAKPEEETTTVAAEEAGAAPEAAAEAPAKEAPAKSSDVVEVSKEDLQNFMRRLNDLEADNKRLLEAADKARLAAINERERSERTELPVVKLTRIGGPNQPLVIAWQMPIGANQSYVDGNRLVEHQEMEVFYQDGKSERMPLLTFYRQQNKDTKAQIMARTKNADGSESLKVRIIATGEELDIDLKFVN